MSFTSELLLKSAKDVHLLMLEDFTGSPHLSRALILVCYVKYLLSVA